MAIIAPRYSPSVAPNSMPTPQVRPEMGLANGLASIGESIASIGRTAESYQAAQERHAKVKAATVDAKIVEGAQKWEEDTLVNGKSKFDMNAVGSRTMPERVKYGEYLNRSTEEYTKDFSPEEAELFNKRIASRQRIYGMQADMAANDRNGKWVVDTQNKSYAHAMEAAAAAKAAGDVPGFENAMVDAKGSRYAASVFTGSDVNEGDIVADANAAALDILIRGKQFDRAAEIHKQGGFGKNETVANAVMAPVYDTMWADKTAGVLYAKHAEVATPPKAGEDADGVSEAYADQYTTMARSVGAFTFNSAAAIEEVSHMEASPERKEKALAEIADKDSLDRKRREALGQRLKAELENKQLVSPEGAEALIQSPQFAAILSVLPAEQAAKLRQQAYQGSDTSDPMGKTKLDLARRDGSLTEGMVSAEVLSPADRKWFTDEARKPPADFTKEALSAARWTIGERGTLPVSAASENNADSEGKANYVKALALHDAFMEEVAENPDLAKKLKVSPHPDADIRAWMAQRHGSMTRSKDWTFGIDQTEQTYGQLAMPPLGKAEDSPAMRSRLGYPLTGDLTPDQRFKYRAALHAELQQSRLPKPGDPVRADAATGVNMDAPIQDLLPDWHPLKAR